ncbi:MAG: glycosyltransferase [Tepidisphaeraceae bacterium]|jgi:glycosyltransferase involved in cell wall biosynthesis
MTPLERPRNRNVRQFATTLPIDGFTGWGVYGLNLAVQSLTRGLMPVIALPPKWSTLHPFDRAILSLAEATRVEFEGRAGAGKDVAVEGPVLIALGNQFAGTKFHYQLRGTSNVATIFLEDPHLSEADLQKAKTFDKIIVGSTWNKRVLENYGLENIAVVFQGIDPSLFYPGPKSGLWDKYFVIFSGGKLEYRKGQDIVIAAVREFQTRHPETILAFAWHNSNPNTMVEIETAGWVTGIPAMQSNGLADLLGWLKQQGVKRFLDVGPHFNWQMGALLRDVDVAVFASRAEGGTNLVAMECMASGIPTILSANTGHLDLISEETCYPLTRQTPPKLTKFFNSVDGWGETSVEELVETLERVYRDRQEARRRGAAAAQAMLKFSWKNRIGQLLREINLGPE